MKMKGTYAMAAVIAILGYLMIQLADANMQTDLAGVRVIGKVHGLPAIYGEDLHD